MKNKDVISLISLYRKHLTHINGVRFSHRELEVISCFLHGRTSKGTAALLAIAPKTVDTHTYNLMKKTAVSSREGLINFIEASGKLSIVRQYYSYLLLQNIFRKSIAQITTMTRTAHEHTFKLYGIHKNEQENFLQQLVGDLACINIKVGSREHKTQEKSKNEKTDFYIEFCEKSTSTPGLVIRDEEYIDLSKCQSYYAAVFELLGRCISGDELEKVRLAFQEKSKTIHSKTSADSMSSEIFSSSEEKCSKKSTFLLFRHSLFLKIFVCFFIIVGIWLCFKLSKIDSARVSHKENVSCATWNIPRQDIVFVGREDLLKNISSILTSDQNLENSQPLAITACAGLGGIGKTQLALQYIHHTKHFYTLKAWFPAEDVENFYENYVQFAKSLGYKEEKPTRERVIAYVNKWLSEKPGWLLVYDNVNDYQEIKPFLPERGGHVILTTRQRSWPLSVKTLYIDIMKEKEALALLSSFVSYTVKNEQRQAKELAKSLGYLPLALAQAGAYMKQNKIRADQYMSLYKLHEPELLSDCTLQEELNIKPVQVTWNITLDKISGEGTKENLIAIDLLTVISYLNPDKISREMLLQWLKKAYPDLKNPDLLLNKTLGMLWSYSVINFDDQFVSIHRLMQTVLRYKHQAVSQTTRSSKLTEAWYQTLLEAINAEYSRKTALLEDEERKKFLLSHMQALLDHCRNQPWKGKKFLSALSDVLHNIAFTYHYLMSSSKKGKPYYERSLAIKEGLYGKNSLELSHLLVHFGNAYGALGDPIQQQHFLKRALLITEQKCGKNDKRLVEIIEGLGAAYWAAGQSREAIPILERGLGIAKNHKKDLIIKIADLKYFLGSAYGVLGQYNKQEKLLQETLHVYKIHYHDHFQTAFALMALGITYRDLGFSKKSKEYLEKALIIQKKSFGEDYVEVGEGLRHLGYTHLDLGYPRKAKALIERAIVILENYYGKDHIYVIRALDFLADAHLHLQNPEKARNILLRNLKIKESTYGKDHIYLAKTYQSLGNSYMKLGDFKKSLQYLMNALNTSENYYGKHHTETAGVYITLGQMYLLQKNRNLSEDFLKKALYIARTSQHPMEYMCLEALADLSLEAISLYKGKDTHTILQDEKIKALYFLQQAHQIVTKYFPKDSPHRGRIEAKLKKLK